MSQQNSPFSQGDVLTAVNLSMQYFAENDLNFEDGWQCETTLVKTENTSQLQFIVKKEGQRLVFELLKDDTGIVTARGPQTLAELLGAPSI